MRDFILNKYNLRPKMKMQQNMQTFSVSSAEIRPSLKQVARYIGGGAYRFPEQMIDAVGEIIDRTVAIAEPVFGYALHEVSGVRASNELEIKGECAVPVPADDFDEQAQILAACICSLGAPLDDLIHQKTMQKDVYTAAFVDAVGTAMLENLAEKSMDLLEDTANGLSLFAGCRFGPGYRGLAMEAQVELFRLIDASAVGVHLNESLVMRPLKSLSFFVIFSKIPREQGKDYKCSRCHLAKCRYRAVDFSVH